MRNSSLITAVNTCLGTYTLTNSLLFPLTDGSGASIFILSGGVAELVDARDLKSRARKSVRVRFPPSPPVFVRNGGENKNCHGEVKLKD